MLSCDSTLGDVSKFTMNLTLQRLNELAKHSDFGRWEWLVCHCNNAFIYSSQALSTHKKEIHRHISRSVLYHLLLLCRSIMCPDYEYWRRIAKHMMRKWFYNKGAMGVACPLRQCCWAIYCVLLSFMTYYDERACEHTHMCALDMCYLWYWCKRFESY